MELPVLFAAIKRLDGERFVREIFRDKHGRKCHVSQDSTCTHSVEDRGVIFRDICVSVYHPLSRLDLAEKIIIDDTKRDYELH